MPGVWVQGDGACVHRAGLGCSLRLSLILGRRRNDRSGPQWQRNGCGRLVRGLWHRRSRRSLLVAIGHDRSPQTELELRLGGTEQGLVDLGVLGVEGDVSAGAVGETLEDDLLGRGDVEELAELGPWSAGVLLIQPRLQLTFAGRTLAPKSLMGSLNFLLVPCMEILMVIKVSIVTGTVVAMVAAGRR